MQLHLSLTQRWIAINGLRRASDAYLTDACRLSTDSAPAALVRAFEDASENALAVAAYLETAKDA